MGENLIEENRKKGNEAEQKFKEWLDKHDISYMYIHQDQDTFSSAFKETKGKRPDFLVLIPHFGLIFIDVKYKKINQEFKTFPFDSNEAKKYSSLQRKFNLHIWYVLSNEDFAYKTWFWIPASKILEEGLPRFVSRKSLTDFFAVSPDKCIQISENDSLNRLFEEMA